MNPNTFISNLNCPKQYVLSYLLSIYKFCFERKCNAENYIVFFCCCHEGLRNGIRDILELLILIYFALT